MQPTEFNPSIKTSEAYDYPDNWESSCLWDGKISVHLGYADGGWILMSLLSTAYLGHIVIYCSEVFNPFCDLIDWLKAIAANKLPARLKIDEEGGCKTLIALPYQGAYSKYADIEIRVIGDYADDEANATKGKCYFLSRALRSQFLANFTRCLDLWLKEDYNPDDWNSQWREYESTFPNVNLRNLDIEGLKVLINSRTQT